MDTHNLSIIKVEPVSGSHEEILSNNDLSSISVLTEDLTGQDYFVEKRKVAYFECLLLLLPTLLSEPSK